MQSKSEIAKRFKEEKREYILKSLHYLADNQDKWTCYDELPLPDEWTFKMVHSVVKYLIRRGFSGGCDCGCRSDLCITDKGLEYINRERTCGYRGY